jgi:hypothetical protein
MAEYRPLMSTVCVNVRCNACDRSLVAVQMIDRQCEERLNCGLRPLLDAYVFPEMESASNAPEGQKP